MNSRLLWFISVLFVHWPCDYAQNILPAAGLKHPVLFSMVVAVSRTFMRQHETPWPKTHMDPNEPLYRAMEQNDKFHQATLSPPSPQATHRLFTSGRTCLALRDKLHVCH
jgi:hypothetical protein